MIEKLIRLAKKEDCEQILSIYKPFITDTVITFEYEVPSMEDFQKRMNKIQSKYPWFVCEINNQIVGYAYASQFHERAAYEWSIDFSIYIKPEYHGKKIGKALYQALINTVKLQGFCNAYALITSANIKSAEIHKALGFREVGTANNVGYKMGKWLDVTWFELYLSEHEDIPKKTLNINEVKNYTQFQKILEEAEEIINYEKIIDKFQG